jgi:hypothetical protein
MATTYQFLHIYGVVVAVAVGMMHFLAEPAVVAGLSRLILLSAKATL